MQRLQLNDSHIQKTIELVIQQTANRLGKHGFGAYMSNHEALGIVTEEYSELVDAVRSNDNDQVLAELMDVAVGCVIAVASMVAGSEKVDDETIAARRARDAMIERAKKSGLEIPVT